MPAPKNRSGRGQGIYYATNTAVAAPFDELDPNPYASSWGKADAYYYLAQACQADGKTELARKYAAEGLGKYPHNPRLKGLEVIRWCRTLPSTTSPTHST